MLMYIDSLVYMSVRYRTLYISFWRTCWGLAFNKKLNTSNTFLHIQPATHSLKPNQILVFNNRLLAKSMEGAKPATTLANAFGQNRKELYFKYTATLFAFFFFFFCCRSNLGKELSFSHHNSKASGGAYWGMPALRPYLPSYSQ